MALSLIKLIRKIHNICMYVCLFVCMYINIVLIYHIILLCMIKVRVRWCTCSGKLIGLLFCLLFLLSILFLKPNIRTYKKCKD